MPKHYRAPHIGKAPEVVLRSSRRDWVLPAVLFLAVAAILSILLGYWRFR